jgi:hypothetical protein
MENKWLTMGVTPPTIAALFPPSAYETVKIAAAKANGAKGRARVGVLKDLTEDMEKLHTACGTGEFTYKDVMLLYGKDRYFAYKLLATIAKRTGTLNCKEVPRTSRGKEASIYSFKLNWKEQENEGL